MSLLSKVFNKLGYELIPSDRLQSVVDSNRTLKEKVGQQKEILREAEKRLTLAGEKFKTKDLANVLHIDGEPIRFHIAPDIYGRSSHKLTDIREFEPFLSLAKSVVQPEGSMLYYDRLFTLYQALESTLKANEKNNSQRFTVLEAGVYKGGGSYFIASTMQTLAPAGTELKLYSVDTFEGHSDKDLPDGKNDIKEGIHLPGMFNETSYEQVKNYLSAFPFVEVIQARIQDCEEQLGGQLFDLIHLDMDIYHPTLYGLNFYKDKLKPWGMFVMDDFGFKTCPGVMQAVDEFLSQNPGQFHKFFLMTGQCILVKVSAS